MLILAQMTSYFQVHSMIHFKIYFAHKLINKRHQKCKKNTTPNKNAVLHSL